MSEHIIIRPAVIDDVIAHSEFIGRDCPSAARRFIEACESTFSLLAQFPEMGAVWQCDEPEYKNVRHRTVSGFHNYVVFYRFADKGVELIRVLHGARDLSQISKLLDD